MSDPIFSPQDAQNLVIHAQTAPLQHMNHAAEISTLLQRFQQWYGHVVGTVESIESRIAAAVKEAEDKVRAEFAAVKADVESASKPS